MQKFAVMGHGVVGYGVVELFYKNKDSIITRSGDEMEYLGDGFNQMVDTLRGTIEEVYVAQICQRDA